MSQVARKSRPAEGRDAGEDEAPGRARAHSAATWFGIGISLVAVGVLLFRVNFRDLLGALRAANVVWLLPALVLFFVMFGLRAWRWAVLLGGTRFWPTWHANAIGYFFNVTLPLRLGEIARAYVIARRESIPMARALSAVLVERLVDLMSVLLLFAWFARSIPFGPTFTRAAGMGSAAMVGCMVLAVLIVVLGERIERVLSFCLKGLGKERVATVLNRLRQIREGLRSVGSAKRLAHSLVLTIAIWALTIALTQVWLKGFLPEADGTRAGLVVVFANLGGALPSAPGGLGIVQGFATSALVVPFGVPESTALAFVLVWSLGQQLLLILLGLLSIGRVGLSFNEIRAGARDAEPKPAVTEPQVDRGNPHD